MQLRRLIELLEQAPQDKVVPRGFCNPHSHRGNYYDLAFEPATDVSVSYMLEQAKSALNSTYEGWKGGDFTMDEYTDCYIANIGSSGEEISELLMFYMLS